MKNCLFVTYYFPPAGGPGVQRVLKHIQYLPEFGWNPIVLIPSAPQYQAYDHSLMAGIPSGCIVEHAPIWEPHTLYKRFMGKRTHESIDVNVIKKDDQTRTFKEAFAEFVRASLFIPDARIGWRLPAVQKARALVRQYDIQAVVSSSPPYTCSLIAHDIKKKCGIPWVAEFRDPWTNFLTTPKRWWLPAMIDRAMERTVFHAANAVECAWQGIIEDALTKYPELPRKKFHHIPNGFDAVDFAEYAQQDSVPNDCFTLTYTGSMYGRRNPQALLSALELLVERGVLTPSDVRFVVVGRWGHDVDAMMTASSFAESIVRVGYVPHKESIAELFRADVLVLIVDEAKESEHIVPGKVYEYIGTQKPVLAIGPERSAIGDLLRETQAGLIAHQSDITALANAVETMYRAWCAKAEITHPDINAIMRYERRSSAKMLAELLDGVL